MSCTGPRRENRSFTQIVSRPSLPPSGHTYALMIGDNVNAITPEINTAVASVKARFRVTKAVADTRVVVWAPSRHGRVAYKVVAEVIPLQAYFHVYVDAETGAILHQRPAAFDQRLQRLPEVSR